MYTYAEPSKVPSHEALTKGIGTFDKQNVTGKFETLSNDIIYLNLMHHIQ